MRIVRRNHEGTLHCLIIRLLRSALCKSDALQHIREARTSHPLLRLRTRLLIAEDGGSWHTMALAGTMPYEGTTDCRWSGKNIAEQQMVADYISQCLSPFVTDMTVTEPYTIRAGNLLHLRSDFSFRFGNDTSDVCGIGNVIETLHPTPAVCGLPKNDALRFILENENVDRRYYSGFLGPWHTGGKASLSGAWRYPEPVA